MLNAYAQLVNKLNDQASREKFAAPDGIVTKSYKAWLTSHDAKHVDTLQARVLGDGRIVLPWSKPNRKITVKSNHVRLDNSRRDFAGVRVLASSDNLIVVTDDHQVWSHRAAE